MEYTKQKSDLKINQFQRLKALLNYSCLEELLIDEVQSQMMLNKGYIFQILEELFQKRLSKIRFLFFAGLS